MAEFFFFPSMFDFHLLCCPCSCSFSCSCSCSCSCWRMDASGRPCGGGGGVVGVCDRSLAPPDDLHSIQYLQPIHLNLLARPPFQIPGHIPLLTLPVSRLTTSDCSKEDECILIEAYQKNPKPDKATRADIEAKVALGAREIQVSTRYIILCTIHAMRLGDGIRIRT